MAERSYKGVIHNKTVTLKGKVKLPEGTEVWVTPMEKKGSSKSLLNAITSPPHLKSEDVDEWMRLIEEGKLPVRYENPLTRKRKR